MKPSTANAKLPPPGTEWEILNLYQSIVHEERSRREAEESAQKKKKFKEALDQQIRDAKLIKEQLENTDRQYHESSMKELQNFEENQKKLLAQERKKHTDELLNRKKQIEDHIKQNAIERAAALRIEEEMIRFAQEKAQLEKEKISTRKIEEAKKQKQIVITNELNRERHKQQKLVERDEDNRLMKEYEAKLDREAYDRDNAFKKRMENIDAMGSLFNQGAGKAAREEEIRLEKFLLSEAKKKEDADAAALAKKEHERREREEKARIENERMLAWRKRMEEIEKKEEEELAYKYKRDLDTYRSEELERWKSNKEKQMHYRLALRAQEMAKEHELAYQGSTPMHTREREINMDVLSKAMEDVPDIVEKIPRRRPMSGNAVHR